jgi:hypothetical protein
MMKHTGLAVLLSTLWLSAGGIAMAQDLSPESFVRADIAAREATLDGMAARLTLLQRGASRAMQAQLEEENRRRVDAVLARHHTTGPAHAAYGTRHRAAIVTWLEAHPGWQRTYEELTQRFEALSGQIDALIGGN